MQVPTLYKVSRRKWIGEPDKEVDSISSLHNMRSSAYITGRALIVVCTKQQLNIIVFFVQLLCAFYCVTQLKLYTVDKLSSPTFFCLSVCEASVTPNQISTFFNIYRHTSPLLTLYPLIPSSTNLY